MKLSSLLFSGSIALLLAGCSDPADKVAKATTSTATNTAAASTSSATGQKFALQPDSKVEFTASKVTRSHNGGFKTFSGDLNVDQNKIVGSPQIKIDMSSTWTDTDQLTGHLKSKDFFDVEKFPTSTFTITSIEGDGAAAKVNGNLELHGVTKAISFPANLEVKADAVHLSAEFSINRKDFQIIYPGKPDDLIRDNVVLRLDVKATPAKG